MYRGHIGWTSEINYRIISLGSSLLEPQHRQSSPRGTPLKFGWNRDGVGLSRKPAISLKRGTIGPWLLLMTNRKSHTPFWLVPKSMTLDDCEGPLHTVFQCFKHVRLSEPTTKIWMKIDPYYQQRRCSPMTLDSGNIRFVQIFVVVLRIYVNFP